MSVLNLNSDKLASRGSFVIEAFQQTDRTLLSFFALFVCTLGFGPIDCLHALPIERPVIYRTPFPSALPSLDTCCRYIQNADIVRLVDEHGPRAATPYVCRKARRCLLARFYLHTHFAPLSIGRSSPRSLTLLLGGCEVGGARNISHLQLAVLQKLHLRTIRIVATVFTGSYFAILPHLTKLRSIKEYVLLPECL